MAFLPMLTTVSSQSHNKSHYLNLHLPISSVNKWQMAESLDKSEPRGKLPVLTTFSKAVEK